MSKERMIRSRRRGLNPTKVVFVYCLAFILVAFHQSGRIADWFDDLALRHDGFISEKAFVWARFFRETIQPYGPAQLNYIENKALAFFSAEAGNSFESAGQKKQNPESSPMTGETLKEAAPSADVPSGQGELLPKSHLEAEGTPGGPYAELPPIYWIRESFPANPASDKTGPEEEPVREASLAGPKNDLSSLGRNPDVLFNPETVLLLGDSMMLEGLGPPLQRALKKYEGLKVFRDGRYGTGLTRLDNFDWLNYFDEMLVKYQPDLVVITIGANDAQDMVGEGRRVHLASDKWNEIYAARVGDLLSRARSKGTTVFWVGLPIMGREPYGSRIAAINQLARTVCDSSENCRFWDSWLSVADAQGKYATYLSGAEGKSLRVRAKDNIHLTEAGGRIMAEKFLSDIAGWVDFDRSGQENGGEERPDEEMPLAPSAGEGGEIDAAQAVLKKYGFFSALRGRDTFYYLARPESDSGGPLPLVLLLHGAWDSYDAWVKNIGPEKLADLAAASGLVLLMPDGDSFGWYVDGRESAIESYLVKELLPHVLKSHPGINADLVGVTGLSMGGHGALTLTMKHPALFKATGAMSAISDLRLHSQKRHPVDPQLLIEKAVGPAGPGGENWRGLSAQGMTEDAPDFWRGRPLIISVGREDALTAEENRVYHRLLTELGIDHVFRETGGDHSWKYWGEELPVHLDFMSRQLRVPN